jgi:AcrR family transcriptional regulator
MKLCVKPVDLRRTLLDASLELIASEGLEGFSMREVARRAGVSHQAPYHHFPDREAILAALVAEGFAGLRERALTAIAAERDPASRLTALGKAYVGFAIDNPAHFKLMFRSELVRAERHAEAKACAESVYAVLVATAGDVAEEKYGRPDPTLVLAAWSLAHGLATLMLEGKLDREFATGRERMAAAHAAMEMFEGLLRGEG